MAGVEKVSATFSSMTREYAIHLVGGGKICLELEAADLEDVAHLLATQRHLLGRAPAEGPTGDSCLALVPANRIQLVIDADA